MIQKVRVKLLYGFIYSVFDAIKKLRHIIIYLRSKYFLQNGENFGPSVSRHSYNWLVPVVEKQSTSDEAITVKNIT
jgi:hypothetical protein